MAEKFEFVKNAGKDMNFFMYNFILPACDTDSITICKPDQSPFSDLEIQKLTDELNNLFPELIKWDFEPKIDKIIVLKTKNYVLFDGTKIKYKGSALKSPTLEPALREFITQIVEAIIFEKDNFEEIYLSYVKEIMNVQDIKRWSTRKTISDKTINSERTNESKIRDAFKETEYVEGDRINVFFKSDETLSLVENFNGDYSKEKLLEKLFKTSQRFETIFPNHKDIFINFKLKKNKEKLNELLGYSRAS